MNKFNFGEVIRRAEKAKKDIPNTVANTVINYSLASFKYEGFDKGMQPWKPLKYPERKKSKTKGILVGTGRLHDAVSNSLKHANWNEIVFKVGDVPSKKDGKMINYAQAHNEGFKGTVTVRAHQRRKMGRIAMPEHKGKVQMGRGATGQVSTVKSHTRKMNLPKRQYMGNSRAEQEEITRVFNREIGKLFNQ